MAGLSFDVLSLWCHKRYHRSQARIILLSTDETPQVVVDERAYKIKDFLAESQLNEFYPFLCRYSLLSLPYDRAYEDQTAFFFSISKQNPTHLCSNNSVWWVVIISIGKAFIQYCVSAGVCKYYAILSQWILNLGVMWCSKGRPPVSISHLSDYQFM